MGKVGATLKDGHKYYIALDAIARNGEFTDVS